MADMMVPQRTTLAGWCQLLPCLYLLYDALRPDTPWGLQLSRGEEELRARWNQRAVPWRQTVLLGVMAGMLPMVNTHCFLGLGLASAGWMAYDLARCRHQRMKAVLFWGLYGALAVLLALPQLFTWTFNQAVGSGRFLKPSFNWVNHNAAGGLRDGYLWFYLKNIGLPFLLILLGLIEKNEKRRFIACGAFVIFLSAEFIQFQPNEYDNNKLFYIWYMLCAVPAADYGLELLGRLKGLRARPVIAALGAFVCFFTGTLAVAREAVSDYEMFPAREVEAARFLEENTAQDAVFMTGDQHINFVSSLAGRAIVCGPDLWLSFHGYDNKERHDDVAAFYADPLGNLDILEKYGVDYILVSDRETGLMRVNTRAMAYLFPVVYTREEMFGQVTIYRAELKE